MSFQMSPAFCVSSIPLRHRELLLSSILISENFINLKIVIKLPLSILSSKLKGFIQKLDSHLGEVTKSIPAYKVSQTTRCP